LEPPGIPLRITPSMRIGAKYLSYGVYFGASEIRRDLPRFSVSLLKPTLRAEDIPLHTHDNASFVFVVAGMYLSSASGTPPVCPPSTIIFNPAGTTHRDSFALASGRFLAISISDEALHIAAQGDALPSVATTVVSEHAAATALRLVRQCIAFEVDASAVMEELCWELLSSVSKARSWPEKYLPPWIRRAEELLQDHCADPVPITDMAQQLGVHPVYFARAFRKVFRCTPGEYRMRCRLNKGMALLRNVNLPLSDIALKAGFFDQSHFTRAFRDHFGIPPHAYRKLPCGEGRSS
jgi:AraC family transcriptional regulator